MENRGLLPKNVSLSSNLYFRTDADAVDWGGLQVQRDRLVLVAEGREGI